MNSLISLHNSVFERVGKLDALFPLLARFLFAAVLFLYFWNSGLTKLGDGLFGIFQPSVGAYAQIFPRAFEAVGYDTSAFGVFHWLVVFGGTVAEFALPIASLGMIGFIVVQSLTDIVGHGADAATVGAWFDRFSDAHIMDQRAFWVFILLVLVVKGGGRLSLDRVLGRVT
jgi:putative oxidoreductase